MAEYNAVPASWLTITGVIGAVPHLELLGHVDDLGIEHDDLDAVRFVWQLMTSSIQFPEAPLLVGTPRIIKHGDVPVEQRWQRWHDGWRNADRDLRWHGPCITCGRNTWAFMDGENDPRGPLGDNALWSVSDDDEPPSRTCAICANTEGSYLAAREFILGHEANEWQALVWPDTGADVEPVGEITYRIVRRYQNDSVTPEVVATGLTRDEAQKHCRDPETSSSTATSVAARARTVKFGPWFDEFEAE